MRVEAFAIQDGSHEVEQLLPDTFGELWIPDRMRHYENTKSKERSNNLQHFVVTGFRQISIPESQEQRFEIVIETSGTLKRKEDVVHGDAGNIISRVSPFASRTI